MATIFAMPTYGCICGYSQDFTPSAENNARHFPEYPDLPLGACPTCYAKGVRPAPLLAQILNTSTMQQANVITEAEIDVMTKDDLDANGKPIIVETGSRYEMKVDQTNGAISSVKVLIYGVQQRTLTDAEHQAEVDKMNQAQQDLAAIAVKEITS